MKKLLFLSIALTICLLCSTCTKPEEIQSCEASYTLLAENRICMEIEHADLSVEQISSIEEIMTRGITSIHALMPIDSLLVRIVDNPSMIIPEIGIGGFNPDEQEVIIAIDVGFNAIDQSLEEELIPMLAHEIHHAKRRRSVGYGHTLLEASVSEGLADHFSIEVTGIEPPLWSVALAEAELQAWTDTASTTWNQPGYDHYAWFFGTDQRIPRWAGYSIGFELVNRYVSTHPTARASLLHNEPANSFVP